MRGRPRRRSLDFEKYVLGFRVSRCLFKSGIVLIDPDISHVLHYALQYNPEKLTRRLEARASSGVGDWSEAFR